MPNMFPGEHADPSGTIIPVVSGTPLSLGPCRSLCVGAAGTATMVDMAGNTLTNFPLQAGYNPVRVQKVTFGTASNVWALY